MIYTVEKYHKTELGETSSSEKIEKADATLAWETALSKFYELNKNYTDDKTVIAWRTAIICPSDMTIRKTDGYSRPIEEPISE